jgi:uncharacterized repeat protein (TIGR01451 family)
MKAWLRSVRGMRWLVFSGLIGALAVAIGRGQAVPQDGQLPSSEEPPMVGAQPPSPVSPRPPFMPPPPTPLPPEQAAPFVPGMPFPAVGPMDLPAPMVRLRLNAPARIEPDKEIEYRITVDNFSSADAHHVLVRDRLPRGVDEYVRVEPKCEKTKAKDGLTDLLWDLGTLKAGEQKTIVLVIKPKGSEDVDNRAYVQFEHGQKVTTRIAKPGAMLPTQSAIIPTAKPSVRVRVTAPAQAIRYQSIPFHIEVVNTGSALLRNVVVTDELPAGLELGESKPEPKPDKPLTWKLGDLPPQQTRRIDYQLIAKQNGTFRNKVNVSADGGASDSGAAAVTVGEAKLKISVSGPERRLINRPILYHITVANLGTIALTNVQVSDELPPGGPEFVSVSPGGRHEGGFVRWPLGTLAPGEVRSLSLVLRCPKPGDCWNAAVARTDNDLSDKAQSGMTRIDKLPTTPVIEIDRSADRLAVGSKATYTIRLFNPGPSHVDHPSVLVAVPNEMSILCQRGPTSGKQEGQQVRFDPLKILNAGQDETYFVEVEAKKAGTAHFRAWWTNGGPQTGPTETWDDKTDIIDPAAAANRTASQVRNLQTRYFLRALTRRLLEELTRSRSPAWTWADTSEPIP